MRACSATALWRVEKRGELLRLVGCHTEHDSRLAPWFLKRVAHIARHGRQRFIARAVRGAPAIPRPLQLRCSPLCAHDQVRISHGAVSPLNAMPRSA